jgi:hypothetical protein
METRGDLEKLGELLKRNKGKLTAPHRTNQFTFQAQRLERILFNVAPHIKIKRANGSEEDKSLPHKSKFQPITIMSKK